MAGCWKKAPTRSPAFTIPKLIANAASGQLSIQWGLRGPNVAIVTACASAANSIGEAFRQIQYGDADVMISGGSEAALTHMGLAGFAAMRALSERNDDPAAASRPFDRDRDGFVLSEGAGVLVLEELEHAQAREARIYAEMLGYGMSADGGHITQPDREGIGAAHAMLLWPPQRRARSAGGGLHQRPRNQHPLGRRGRNEGHQSRSSRNTPTGSASPARRASSGTCWGPAAASS